jgi:hypothetical protein
MMGYDRKYGRVTIEKGEPIPDDEPVVVFRGRDRLLPAILSIYIELSDLAGSPDNHIELATGTYELISNWQLGNPLVRTPQSTRWNGE